jgi:uncharacterized membrane protein
MSRTKVPVAVVADRLIAALAAAGAAISLYLTITQLTSSAALFCERGGGCDVVQSSRWAVFFGAPTAAWGAVHFATLLALALAGFTAARWLAAFIIAAAGVGFVGYLTWIELAVLKALCPYCLAASAIAVACLIALVVRRPRVSARRLAGRPARLAVLGAGTVVVTVAVVAAAFLADTPQEASDRQTALARHLTGSGAIFYGAYW